MNAEINTLPGLGVVTLAAREAIKAAVESVKEGLIDLDDVINIVDHEFARIAAAQARALT